MRFEIKNRFTGAIQWHGEIGLGLEYKDKEYSIQLGVAVKTALKESADLRSANLRSANLRYADLQSANLQSADLRSAKGIYQIVPEVGSFVAFKKLSNGTIAKLLIPEDAERIGGITGRKCRASKAIVLEGSGFSSHNNNFSYAVGEIITPDKWDNNPYVECSNGIHFFISRKEAEEY